VFDVRPWYRCAILALIAMAAGCDGPNPAYQGRATAEDAQPEPGLADAAVDLPLPPPLPDASSPEAAPSPPDLAVGSQDSSPPDLAFSPPDVPNDQPAASPEVTPDLRPAPIAVPMTDLVGYWPFDETAGTTAADLSANHFDGMLRILDPRTCWDRVGRVGGAIVFPSPPMNLDVGIEVPVNTPVRNLQKFTFSAWVKHARDDGNHHAIVSRQLDDTSREVFFFGFDGPDLVIYLMPVPVNDTVQLKASVPAVNTWVHVAVTYDRINLRLFANGKPVGLTWPHNQPLAPSEKPLYIGTNKNAAGVPHQPWDGWLDEVTIWSVNLPEARIAELASGRPLMIVP
jgi:hypothetical protein